MFWEKGGENSWVLGRGKVGKEKEISHIVDWLGTAQGKGYLARRTSREHLGCCTSGGIIMGDKMGASILCP